MEACGAALVTLVLLPELSGATGYLWTHGLLPLRPMLAMPVGLVAIFVVALMWDLRETGGAGLVACYRRYAPIAAGLALLVAVRLLWILHPGSLWIKHGYYAVFPLYGLLVFLVLLSVRRVPGFVRHYRVVVLVPYLVVVISMWADALRPGTFSMNDVQVAGFLANPNFGAGLLMALTIAALEWRRREGRDWLLWYVTAPLMVMTGSRMGILMCLCAGFWWLTLPAAAPGGARAALGRSAGLALGLVAAGAGLGVWMALDPGAATWIFHKWTSFLHPHELATGVRAGLLQNYLAAATRAPLLGHGVDFWMRNRWGPHNSYVGFEISYGVSGLLAYSIFYLTAFWAFLRAGNRRGMVFTVVALAMQSFFMDLVLDHRFMLMLLALVCAAGCAEPSGAPADSGGDARAGGTEGRAA